MHLFYISSIVYTEEENVYVYIPSKKSIEGSAGLRLELKITTTDFRSCHKVPLFVLCFRNACICRKNNYNADNIYGYKLF